MVTQLRVLVILAGGLLMLLGPQAAGQDGNQSRLPRRM
jgi:hypothetical protein